MVESSVSECLNCHRTFKKLDIDDSVDNFCCSECERSYGNKLDITQKDVDLLREAIKDWAEEKLDNVTTILIFHMILNRGKETKEAREWMERVVKEAEKNATT